MTRSKKILTASVASVLLLLLLLFFGIVPLVNSILGATGALKAERQKLGGLESQQKGLEDFRRFKLENAENLQELKTLLVDAENPSPFFSFLETLARQEGFVPRIIPQEPKKLAEDRWAGIEFQVSSRTSYPQMYAFLEKLEQGPYLLEIRNLHATAREGEIEFTLYFKAYSK